MMDSNKKRPNFQFNEEVGHFFVVFIIVDTITGWQIRYLHSKKRSRLVFLLLIDIS